jgi:hypothetical protein
MANKPVVFYPFPASSALPSLVPHMGARIKLAPDLSGPCNVLIGCKIARKIRLCCERLVLVCERQALGGVKRLQDVYRVPGFACARLELPRPRAPIAPPSIARELHEMLSAFVLGHRDLGIRFPEGLFGPRAQAE